mgnify:CR=1 FL=1
MRFDQMLNIFVRERSLRKKMRFYEKVLTTPKDFGSGSCVQLASMEENKSPLECKFDISIFTFCRPSYTQIVDFNDLEYSLKPYFIDIFFGTCPNTT